MTSTAAMPPTGGEAADVGEPDIATAPEVAEIASLGVAACEPQTAAESTAESSGSEPAPPRDEPVKKTIDISIPVDVLPITITVQPAGGSSSRHEPPPTMRTAAWMRPLLMTLPLMVAMAADAFGLRTATEGASRDAFLKLYALWYGRPDISEQIVVFTFRDADLAPTPSNDRRLADEPCRAESTRWPLSYSDRICLLQALVEARPAAIFVDILFAPTGETGKDAEQFNQSLKGWVRQSKVPIVLADVPAQDLGDTVAPAIRDSGVEFAMAGWRSTSGAYPLWVDPSNGNPRVSLDSIIHGAHGIDARARGEPQSRQPVGTRPALPSPAVSLYRIYRSRLPRDAAGASLPDDRALMRVAWGFDPPPTARHASDGSDAGCARAGLSTLVDILKQAIAGPKTDNTRWLQPTTCLFHRDLPGSTLFRWVQNGQMAENVRDKYVFIGATLVGIPDLWPSPVHGKVPAVHLHAMAFDNLVSMHGKPLHDPQAAFGNGGPFAWTDLIELAAMAGIPLGAMWWRRRHAYRQASAAGRFWRLILGLAIFLALMVACMAALLVGGRMVPANWIALLTMALFAMGPDLIAAAAALAVPSRSGRNDASTATSESSQ